MKASAENNKLMIYGAYGYTGKLIVEQCRERGLSPVLAGRNAEKLTQLKDIYGFDIRAFDLDTIDQVCSEIRGFHTILHCAGPYIQTSGPMLAACLSEKVNYIDITGELRVFESVAAMHKQALQAGISMLPGAGFDVVPSDCMAVWVHTQLPDAQKLILAIYSIGGVSQGTLRTIITNLGESGAIRKDNKITPVPPGWKSHTFDFGGIERNTVTIPWGDVSTAWHSTKIPNIEVYMAVPKSSARVMALSRFFSPVLKRDFVKNLLFRKVQSQKPGPDEHERETGETRIIATVKNDQGKTCSALFTGPEGYSLTAQTAVACADRMLKGACKPGFLTPSIAFGPDFILEFEGVKRVLLD